MCNYLFQCYICSSLDGGCSEDQIGEEKQCQPGQGCIIAIGDFSSSVFFIYKIVVEITADGQEDYRRECSPEYDEENRCEEGETDGEVRKVKLI